jgi:UPF0716 family protein affecting phage T7 exclusion
MARFLTLLALALLTVAEVAAVIALTNWLGSAGALLVLGLDVVVGLMTVSWGARSAPPQRGWRMAAGAVIAIPGLVLDLVGALMLVPPVQRWLSRHVTRGTQSLLRRQGVSVVTVTDAAGMPRTTVVPGDVIPGEVVPGGDVPSTPTDRAGEAPDTGPRVVRGEIAGPDDQ